MHGLKFKTKNVSVLKCLFLNSLITTTTLFNSLRVFLPVVLVCLIGNKEKVHIMPLSQ